MLIVVVVVAVVVVVSGFGGVLNMSKPNVMHGRGCYVAMPSVGLGGMDAPTLSFPPFTSSIFRLKQFFS